MDGWMDGWMEGSIYASIYSATSPPMSQGDRSGEAFKEEEKWLPGDMDHSTPVPLRHAEKIRNQRFSRKKTRDFLERVLQHRVRGGDKLLCRPFVETMMEVLHQELGEEEVTAFAVNIFASVRKYAAEPDFLGFLLLITGQVADVVVRDNRSLCAELLRIFRIYFEVADGSTRVTRQKFFSALRDALPQKEKDQCQELAAYFPASGPMTPVNYEWLLVDDPYVLSPIVYALRLQHLEEGLGLSDRMERQVKSCARDGPVTYEKIEAVCKDDAQLSILQPEETLIHGTQDFECWSSHSSDHGSECSERCGSGPIQLAEFVGELGGGRGGVAAPGPVEVEFGARNELMVKLAALASLLSCEMVAMVCCTLCSLQ
eukprot:s5188_g1.t1